MNNSKSSQIVNSPFKHFLSPILVGLGIFTIASCAMMGQYSKEVVEKKPPQTVEIEVSQEPVMSAKNREVMVRERRLPSAQKITITGSRIQRDSYQLPPSGHETYQVIEPSKINLVSENPVSTFSIDVDTGGYSNIRRMLRDGYLPPKDQVRVEEIINYFSYSYPQPESKENPFTITTTLTDSLWNKNKHLLHIGVQGYEEEAQSLPAANLVFLVDVSGSMHGADKLPLVKQSLKLLVDNLRDEDRVSMVTYAGGTKVVLPSTSGKEKSKIRKAIDKLNAGGSTSGESGLRLAYQEAESGMIEGGNNRIIMMTDGDFNVGLSSVESMVKLVETKRQSGVFLSTAGFGRGNYREDMMEQMANHGNGSYFYIDSYEEAHRAFERNLRSSLFAIAKDVKIQVEFNPHAVKEYRLVGYENRKLNREDFNNDKVDAGDIGQGHSVTAIYEVTLRGNPGSVEPLRYQAKQVSTKSESNELAYIKLRYKPLDSESSKLIEQVVENRNKEFKSLEYSQKVAFAAASFGELLKQSNYVSSDYGYKELLHSLTNVHNDFPGEVAELTSLIRLAESLK